MIFRSDLGQGGFISSLSVDSKTHIATRGSFLLSKMLCHNLEVPPNVSSSNTQTMLDPNLSARQGLTQLTSAPNCAGCHGFINGIGFALENINAFGKSLQPSCSIKVRVAVAF